MNRQQRMINTEYYEYTQINPKNKFGGDCVIRAVALACNQSWEQTIREMTELGIKLGFVCNDEHVYSKYLESKGFKQMKEPRDYNNQKYIVKDWLCTSEYHLWHSYNIVAHVGSHHICCIKDGKVRDIWNSSKVTMHKWWVK